MSSPNDNIQIKDALDNTFKMRAKDISVAQDGSLQAVRHLSTPYPIDYGTGGCFQTLVTSGTMAAGLASGSPIFDFRFTPSTSLAIVRRVMLSMWNTSTGFTAGIGTFSLSVARSWSVDDSGGTTLSTPSRLRAAMGAASGVLRVASTGTLTAGTRTLDTAPISTLPVALSTATQSVFLQRTSLLSKANDLHPIVLVQNEGLVLAATVPATGTWSFAVEFEWDEVPLVNY